MYTDADQRKFLEYGYLNKYEERENGGGNLKRQVIDL